VFEKRSTEPERIDTGDYTPEEYATFLREIAFVNRYFGDRRALRKTLLREIERDDLREFSVLDVGCGSGELLRIIAEFAEATERKASLTGIDLNPISSSTTRSASQKFPEIVSVQGDALRLPFPDDAFDFAVSSLFFHHLTDEQILIALKEMSRVARRGIIVIDLHRHPMAYVLYKIFCVVFRISPLVRHDGSLSILKGFRAGEFETIAEKGGLTNANVVLSSPFRVVLSSASLIGDANRD
jgi:ubiquinone/menaquinone biosynthesis C-methylase UbiE